MSGTITQGRRVYMGLNGYSFGSMEPGDYGVGPDKHWWLCAPSGDRGVIRPEFHTLTEHGDETITISPSTVFAHCCDALEHAAAYAMLSFGDGHRGWHGWLEHGIWRER